MKRFLRVLVPILLAVTIVFGIGWYLFSYDKGFTQDLFLSCGRLFAKHGNMKVASQFYDWAYQQNHDRNAVAVELAEKYIQVGNYTKAETALNRAVKDGANADVYTALSKVYISQDKLFDAVELINNIPDQAIYKELQERRPSPPYSTMDDGPYTDLVSYSIESTEKVLYVNPDGEYPSVHKHLYTAPITLSEGKNSLYAVAVSESGLPSKLQIFEPEVKGVIQEIVFCDPHIEHEIRRILNVSDETVLFTDDLWEIKSFTIPEKASNYSDISNMIQLECLIIENGVSGQLNSLDNALKSFPKTLKELHIRKVPLSSEDMEFIAGLVNLEKLTLEECSLSTANKLSDLTKLKYLNLSYNSIRNISAISNATDLTELNMHRNALNDLSALSKCTKLEMLDVSDNMITDISALSVLSNISELNISNNSIENISTLSNLVNLTSLIASGNEIIDITSLGKCTLLSHLNISRNNISNLDPIANLREIMHLDFSYNSVGVLPQWHSESEFVTIDGTQNLISDLTPLSNLKKINNILMDYNTEIQSVECLANCHTLVKVNIYGTKVVDVSMLTTQSIIVNYTPIEIPENQDENQDQENN